MSNRTKLGLNVVGAALLLGVLGDALLRETPWGLNVLLWTGALAAAMCLLHERAGVEGAGGASWRADGGWLFLPVFFFAAAFVWRDSPTLNLLDGMALFVSLALLAWRARGRSIRLAGLRDYMLGLLHAAIDPLFAGLSLVFCDVQWATIPRRGAMRHVWAAARGLFIAVPLLFIFGALLMAADAVFEGIMQRTFQFDAGVVFSHVFLMLLFAWMTGGFLRGMTLGRETQSAPATHAPAAPQTQAPIVYTSITVDDRERDGAATAAGVTSDDAPGAHRQPPGSVVIEGDATAEVNSADESGGSQARADDESHARVDEKSQTVGEARVQTYVETTSAAAAQGAAGGFSLGAVEVGVVLGLLNVLFACFVVVQFRYFFGGAERVMSITELTYSEYARRGFFELTWVAGLLLPLLLGVHALLRKESGAALGIFRPLAGVQIGLLFVIMASAVARMRLYQSEYGLTELRFYTTAFMLWLGLVFVWFAWTVLVRSNRQRFACGALVAAFVTAGLLHLFNPDAYIVRANVAHARAGRAFDAWYAASLSADAAPALVSALPSLTRDERCLAAREISRRWTPTWQDEDWRGWNFARWRARRAVAKHQDTLSQADCLPPASSAPAVTSTETPAPPAPPDTPATQDATHASTNVKGVQAATDGDAQAATTNAAQPATPLTATMPMTNGGGGAKTNASAPVRATRRDKRKTKGHERTRAVKSRRT